MSDLYYRSKRIQTSNNIQDDQKELHGIVFAELVSFIEQTVGTDENAIFKMTDLADMYKRRFEDLGGECPERIHTTKLKNRLLSQLDSLKEFKEGKNSFLTFDNEIGSVLRNVYENSFDDEALILSRAAEIIRKQIFQKQYSGFDGTFSENCQRSFLPRTLTVFIDLILQGSNINNNHKHLEQCAMTISQLLIQNIVKRTRKEVTSAFHSTTRESPIAVYIGMLLHAKTRKKGLIDKLYDLGISIPYSRVMELSTKLGNEVLAQYKEELVVCPSNLRNNLFTTSALDNIDHDPSSTTSEGSFHGTGISLFQHVTEVKKGTVCKRSGLSSESSKLKRLPSVYADVRPITSYNSKPEHSTFINLKLEEMSIEEQVSVENK